MVTKEDLQQQVQEAETKAREARKQLAQAEQLEREAKRKAEQAARDAERTIQAKKDREAFKLHAEAIVAALVKVGFKDASYVFKSETSSVPKIFCLKDEPDYTAWSIGWEQISRHRWASSHEFPNEFRITIGRYGTKRSFPPKADGSFSYNRIAAVAKELHDSEIAAVKRRNEARSIREGNAPAAMGLLDTYGVFAYEGATTKYIPGGVRVEPSEIYEGKVRVEVTINKHITADQAAKLLQFLKTQELI